MSNPYVRVEAIPAPSPMHAGVEHMCALGRVHSDDAPNPTKVLFAPRPHIPVRPREVTLHRGRWCDGSRYRAGAVDSVDVIGAYVLAAGVSVEELRDVGHLWAWSPWVREVDEINRRAVDAHRRALAWRTHGQRDGHRERAAYMAEQELIHAFARKGVLLFIVGDFVDQGAAEPARAS